MPERDRDRHERVVELAKRRGFFFPTTEQYGGVAGFWTFGPRGAALKHNLERSWRERFAVAEGHLEIDAPTILAEPIFEASGHLEDFADLLVECPACGRSHRADHLVEAAGEVDDAEGLPPATLEGYLEEFGVGCPACGADLAGQPVEPFNLMFETSIGPGAGQPAYLRPETAQAILVDFPRLAEYARGRLPFGVAQIGPAYRNEISPRRSIIRIREMTQAELEVFVDPEGDGPDLGALGERTVSLYPAPDQDAGTDAYATTVADALADGTFANPWVAYHVGLADRWFAELGLDGDRLRYRQHRSDELAHYARECWDAEFALGDDWIELAGIADRGTYDLRRHAAGTGEAYTVFRAYDDPRTVERASVDPDMATLGPRFGGDATAVADALERLAAADPDAFRPGEPVAVEVDGETYEIPYEATGFAVEEATESGEHVTPAVIEPSFGVDRALYAVLDHAYREDEVDGEARRFLALPPGIAPVLAGVFPLVAADGLDDRARDLADRLAAAGLPVEYDESGNIGRRYRRQDEIGTPFCVTVDHQTLEDDTVTLRDRDSTAQVRVAADELEATLRSLRDGRLGFDGLAGRSDAVDREAVD